MMTEDYDKKDESAMADEILDSQWSTGPMAKARQNLSIFCANMLMQRSLRLIVDEILVLEDVVLDEDISIVEKMSARQTLAILNSTWIALADEFGYHA